MPKALLSFSILVDHADKDTPIRSEIKLYREDKGLIWRIGSELGDEVEVLPRPATLAQAKADAIASYPRASVWKPLATWM